MISSTDNLYPTGDTAYRHLLENVLRRGDRAVVRAQDTLEARHVTVTIADPLYAVPTVLRTGFSNAIAATELLQLLAGVSSLSQLDTASKGRFHCYADGGRLRGAYGPRLFGQLPTIERRLRADEGTRQAVAVLWRESEPVTSDVPCTISMTFLIRRGLLHLSVHMRSNDLVLGLPYDWFVFTRVQTAMAEVLNVGLGSYTHHVDSLHIYERDVSRARAMLPPDGTMTPFPTAMPAFTALQVCPYPATGTAFTTWHQVRRMAETILWTAGRTGSAAYATWFDTVVPSLTFEDVICERCRYVVPEPSLCRLVTVNGQHCEECCSVACL